MAELRIVHFVTNLLTFLSGGPFKTKDLLNATPLACQVIPQIRTARQHTQIEPPMSIAHIASGFPSHIWSVEVLKKEFEVLV